MTPGGESTVKFAPMAGIRLPAALALAACATLLAACAVVPNGRGGGFVEAWSARSQAALVEAHLLPAPASYEARYFQWTDHDRQREVLAKLYWPRAAARGTPVPLVVFSHGMGGSREGYSYLGANWAARGYASLHLQHAGSDSRLWSGNPFDMVSRLQSAASEVEAVNRVRDLHCLAGRRGGIRAPPGDAQLPRQPYRRRRHHQCASLPR